MLDYTENLYIVVLKITFLRFSGNWKIRKGMRYVTSEEFCKQEEEHYGSQRCCMFLNDSESSSENLSICKKHSYRVVVSSTCIAAGQVFKSSTLYTACVLFVCVCFYMYIFFSRVNGKTVPENCRECGTNFFCFFLQIESDNNLITNIWCSA